MIAENIYFKPKTVAEAVAMATQHSSDFRFLAGGTDVIVNKFQGNAETHCLIDLTGIDELKQVIVVDDVLHIGSLVKLDDLKRHEPIIMNFPTLLEAAHAVASPMLRKTATIGGNVLCENRCTFYNQSEWWREAVGYCLKCEGDICIATGGKKNCFSKFVSDTAPVLICCDAMVEIADVSGVKSCKLEQLYTGDGINPRTLHKTAIIKSIQLPLGNDYKCIFKKLRPRESVDYSSLTSVVSTNNKGRIKIALGGVDPKPVVVEGEAGASISDMIKQAVKMARVIDNDHYSRLYRKEMIAVFLQRSFHELNLNY
jgi:4-hydroxybenzoyl-CoA reductase subunit beta